MKRSEQSVKRVIRPFSNAWGGVTSHKLRSLLTILGIVIGVSAVIALMSIGKGAEADILARIQTLGADLMMINPGSGMSAGGIRGAQGSMTTLTMEDATAIANKVDLVSSVTPLYSKSLQLIAGSQNMNSQVTGTTPAYMQTYNLNTLSGTFFSDYDLQRGTRVAVLGYNVWQTLYGGSDPLGQDLRLGTIIVRVIGVLESKGSVSGSPDDKVFIPLTAMQQAVAQQRTARGEQVISSISLKVKDLEQSDKIITDITGLLRSRHQLAATAENDFTVTSMEEVASTVSETMQTTTMLLGAIAAISLLVGGIGVMNIMLVSVLERTREIGIRKALGALDRDIWIQFLIESAFLTLAGGLIGVVLGWGSALLLSTFGTYHTLVSVDIVILAVSVSVGIGLFFGFYPAWQASRLNPIEALRHD
ncbi:MAG: ABC transporter permease [Dehalococcoidia bacterium]|nr:ABC transporter permease [Dehalococcoidia bacterium]MDD5494956.1 ABC transporter permease [Dehalococcoidia bacterium]